MGIGAAISGVGALTSIIGGIGSAGEAQNQAHIAQQVAEQEQKIEAQRHQAMILSSRRQQTEMIRNGQLARSMALNSATAQGAQFGSGLAGGQAQIESRTGYNLLGNTQNTEIGQNIFGINQGIFGLREQMAASQGNQAMWQGISSAGNSLSRVGATAGNIFAGGSSLSGPQSSSSTYGGFLNNIGSNGIY